MTDLQDKPTSSNTQVEEESNSELNKKNKKELEASKTVKDKWAIDQFLSEACKDMDHNFELFRETTNRACVAFSVEDEEYKNVVDVIKKYRELEEFLKEINQYTYYLTHSVWGGVMQEWFNKNCEFRNECHYLNHLISEREELENGLINISSSDNEDEDYNPFSTDSRIFEMDEQFWNAYDDFKGETLANIRTYLEEKGEEIYEKLINLLLKEKEGITVPEQQLEAVVEEEYEKIKEDIVDVIAEIEY